MKKTGLAFFKKKNPTELPYRIANGDQASWAALILGLAAIGFMLPAIGLFIAGYATAWIVSAVLAIILGIFAFTKRSKKRAAAGAGLMLAGLTLLVAVGIAVIEVFSGCD